MRKIPYILFALWIFIGQEILAQDPQFTQFYANPLYLAPSFAGGTQEHRLSTSFRDQWLGFVPPGTFFTESLSYDHFFSNYNSGVGFLLLRDKAGSGDLNYTSMGLQYSYNFKINDYIRCVPGIGLNYFVQSLNINKLRFLDEIETGSTAEVLSLPRNSSIDFASSILFYGDKYWAGSSIDHLRKPDVSFFSDERIGFKYTFFGGVLLYKKTTLIKPIDETVTVAYLFKKSGKDNQLDIGAYWKKEPLVFGLWYRGIPVLNSARGDAVALLIGYQIDKSFSFGYSYDLTISNLVGLTKGAHEVTMTFEFITKRKVKLRQIPCPHM